MASKSAVVGGLLSGLGKGMVDQAEVRRQEALERARDLRRKMERQEDRSFKREMRQEDREFRREERRDDREYQGGLLHTVQPDESGQMRGITRSGSTTDPLFGAHQSKLGKGKGKDGTGIDNAQLNTLERITRNFWGTMNENGEFFLPEGTQENYVETLERSEALVMAGMPAARAANVAALSIAGPMDEQAAREQAVKDAKMQGVATPGVFSDGDTNWIDQRTKELMEESRQAERLYQQAVGADAGGRQSSKPSSGEQDQQASGQYASADDVKVAFQGGEITREQALKILRDQFGMQ